MGKSVAEVILEFEDHQDKEHNGTIGIPCDVCSEYWYTLNPGKPISVALSPRYHKHLDLREWH